LSFHFTLSLSILPNHCHSISPYHCPFYLIIVIPLHLLIASIDCHYIAFIDYHSNAFIDCHSISLNHSIAFVDYHTKHSAKNSNLIVPFNYHAIYQNKKDSFIHSFIIHFEIYSLDKDIFERPSAPENNFCYYLFPCFVFFVFLYFGTFFVFN
jgi:hypothetical protein